MGETERRPIGRDTVYLPQPRKCKLALSLSPCKILIGLADLELLFLWAVRKISLDQLYIWFDGSIGSSRGKRKPFQLLRSRKSNSDPPPLYVRRAIAAPLFRGSKCYHTTPTRPLLESARFEDHTQKSVVGYGTVQYFKYTEFPHPVNCWQTTVTPARAD